MCHGHPSNFIVLLLSQYLGGEAEVTRRLRAAVLPLCIK